MMTAIRTTRRSARVAAAAALEPESKPSVSFSNQPTDESNRTTPTKPTKRRKVSDSVPEENGLDAPVSVKKKAKPKKDGTIPTLSRSTPPPPVHLPTALEHLAAADPRFTKLSERVPCRPFLGENGHKDDPFRSLVTSIIGQQVSWMAARSITKRFIEKFCGPIEGDERSDWPFPTPAQVATAEVTELKGVGFSTRKSEYGECLSAECRGRGDRSDSHTLPLPRPR